MAKKRPEIARIMWAVVMVLKKINRVRYDELGEHFQRVIFNCVVLGVGLLVFKKGYTLAESGVYAIAAGVGFGLVLIIFTALREKLERSDIPKAMKGAPIALLTAGLLALAFMGFTGMA